MKVIAIVGSPHGTKGNTGLITNSILAAAREAGADTETLSLADLSVLPCKGCEVCSKTGSCPLDDDCDVIRKALHEADGMILASPLYLYNVSGQIKVLLDRLYSFCHCQMLVGKYGAAVVTSGAADPEPVENYLNDILGKMGCWITGSIGVGEVQLIDEDERANVLESAAALGKHMVQAISSQETYPEQENKRSEFFETMKCVISMQQERWPFEYEYWKSRWGMEG